MVTPWVAVFIWWKMYSLFVPVVMPESKPVIVIGWPVVAPEPRKRKAPLFTFRLSPAPEPEKVRPA